MFHNRKTFISLFQLNILIFRPMTSHETGKKLTEQLILTKTKSPSLQTIKHLNLWGNQLENLQILFTMPSLQVISLSVNKIRSLKYFAKCQKLQELYLRKNCITDLQQLRYLTELPLLKILWLHDNPCAEIPNYRNIVIKFLIHLTKLDNSPVTPQQKTKAQMTIFNLRPVQPEQQPQKIQQVKSSQRPYSSFQNEMKPQQFKEEPVSKNKWLKRPASIDYRIQQPRPNQIVPQSTPKLSIQKNPPSQALIKEEKINKSRQQIEQEFTRNQNVLMAVMSLIRQLDGASLQIVKRQIDKLSRSR